MAGRPPKPTHLKLLQGNPGKRKLNTEEPQPDQIIPDMPKWLEAFPIAVSEWERESRILFKMGIMTEAELGILATRCYLASEIRSIAKEIKKRGRVIRTSKVAKANPLVIQLKNFIAEYRQIGALLGFDPSSRSKIKVKPKEDEDPADTFLKQGK